MQHVSDSGPRLSKNNRQDQEKYLVLLLCTVLSFGFFFLFTVKWKQRVVGDVLKQYLSEQLFELCRHDFSQMLI